MFKVGDKVKYAFNGEEYEITHFDPIAEMYTLRPMLAPSFYYGDYYRSKNDMESHYTIVSAHVPETNCECGIWTTCGKEWPKNRHSRWCPVYKE